MGEIVDLERLKTLEESKEPLPELSIPMMQAMIMLREETETEHRFNIGLDGQTCKSLHLDGVEIEYTLINRIDTIRKVISLHIPGYHIPEIKKDLDSLLLTLFEVFITNGGRPAEEFERSTNHRDIDVIGFIQDVVPLVWKEMRPDILKVGYTGKGNA